MMILLGRPNGGVNYFAQDGDFDLFYVRDLQSKSGEKNQSPQNAQNHKEKMQLHFHKGL